MSVREHPFDVLYTGIRSCRNLLSGLLVDYFAVTFTGDCD